MTDKIIIDDVDVSGCEFLLENSLHKIEFSCNCRGNSQDNALHLHLHCKHNPNCYYKQIKRAEQECERLKKLYEEVCSENLKEIYELIKKNDLWRGIVNVVNEKLEKQLDQLKANNEQLKKQACGLRPDLKYIIDKTCCKYNINAKYYHEKIVEIINNLDQLKAENEELKKIIEEIKEMCSEMKCDSLMQNSWCGDSDFKMNCCEKLFKEQILQEISEAVE